MAKTVVGLFETPSDAQSAMQELQNAGFSGNQASLVSSASSQLSSILGQIGIPQQDANLYLEGMRNGGSLIILQQLGDDEAYRAADVLNRYNVVDIDNLSQRYGSTLETTSTTSSSVARSSGTSSIGSATTGGQRNLYEGGETVIPIVEEELRIGKQEVESGGVRVESRVEEVPVQEQVTLREERVTVERRPVNQQIDPSQVTDVLREGTLEVRERDEQAVVQKEARVVEEVVIGKEVEQRTETIQDTVRRTDVDVEQLQGQTTGTGYVETGRANAVGASGSTSTSGSTASTGGDEGLLERGLSKAGNAVERATGLDIDQDQDVGRRDPRNNI